MLKKENYTNTIIVCCLGYIVQAVVNNFAPLLFVMFKNTYNISFEKIAVLASFNFGIQLIMDLLSSKFIPKIGYRATVVSADIFSVLGLLGLAFLPDVMPDPYVGLLISVMLYAIGGGLLEVVVSPIVEACPTKRKSAIMSLLHSFYCWGHVAVVIISTIFFTVFGISNWRIMALIWALVPFINGIMFVFVPIKSLEDEAEGISIKKLVSLKMFWIMMLIMLCAGAAEQAVSQWASAFAEAGLGVSKTMGDLMGACSFAVLMGLSRVLYSVYSKKMKLVQFMLLSGILCIISYIMASIPASPVINLLGCALCGFSVGIMWPGAYSMASKKITGGGTAMFALLALGGDLGCSSGPALVGYVSKLFGDSLKLGILSAVIFPILLLWGLMMYNKSKQ